MACSSSTQVSYPVEAKKNLANFSVVLDTPEYKRVTELKTHMSDVSRFPKHTLSHCMTSFILSGFQVKVIVLVVK